MEKTSQYQPCNPNATKEVREVLNYLQSISGKGILTGQHTQTVGQKELHYIKEKTGEMPVVCGFELLAYSPNINYAESDEVCLLEVEENKNTIELAYDWALENKGLVTFSWHWFSPIGGKGKAFYAEHTDFDARQALIEGTPEHEAFVSDMDHMAKLLKPFQEKKIPIFWRPFHEANGTWFWWGSKGHETGKRLYQFMYDRYVNVHHLDNLIWVWNSPVPEAYVGDDKVDIISVDLYATAHQHTDYAKEYEELIKITPTKKLVALAEIGVLPDIKALESSKVPWAYFMVWSNEFCDTEKFNTTQVLQATYASEYAIKLPIKLISL